MALLLEGTNQPLCDLVKRRWWTAVTFQWPEVCTTYYRREFASQPAEPPLAPLPKQRIPHSTESGQGKTFTT